MPFRRAAADERFTRRVPLGQWGTPGDIAHAALFLLAAESAWTTGAAIHVDGGYTAH
ncbi:SDR family oxidoreductase [Pseudofrankia sp. BMG5.37]|uniref:SDR family oxidoreductase n=1 Tax=Pseudofrankia sp. BMG5.37 TaxID=3050035 RepID=UPI0037CA65F6